jgi:hypothetical protein
MAVIEQSIEVDVPVSTAYNQWTQTAQFMDGVDEVRQLDEVIECRGSESGAWRGASKRPGEV